MYTTDLHKNSYKNILNSKHLQKLVGDVLIFVQNHTKFNTFLHEFLYFVAKFVQFRRVHFFVWNCTNFWLLFFTYKWSENQGKNNFWIILKNRINFYKKPNVDMNTALLTSILIYNNINKCLISTHN
jgi:hypothetical protein